MADYFIADLHLDPRRPTVLDAFVRWLEGIVPDLGALYILGDLFEAWIGDDASDPVFDPLLDRLAGLARDHHPLYFMPGNRDFLVGDALARRAGWTALDEPARIQCYGTLVGLLHGDTFCTEDHAYQAFRAQVRNRAWQQQFLSRPPAERRAMAVAAREASQQHNAQAADFLMDVTPEAIDEFMRRENLSCLIHGHTHRPAIHHWILDNVPRTRIVLGDWYEQGRILRWDEAGYRLETVGIPPDRS
jgi:UDP-2,3-diacylglucosamine hydrolase